MLYLFCFCSSFFAKAQNTNVEKEHTASKNVQIIDTAFYIPQLDRKRRVWIYLPNNYSSSTTKKYPVLYLQDGQNVFDKATSYIDEWGVDECLDTQGMGKN